jgi:hypothetical protein
MPETKHYKARSFTFIDHKDHLTLSICLDDGTHQYVDITDTQGCLAFDQLSDFAVRQMRKAVG